MFITPAFAKDAASAVADAPNPIVSMAPIFLIIIVFYFMVIRPQSKRIQEHRQMVQALEKGTKVITGGGLVATVVKLTGDNEVVLKLADGVEVTAVRSTIMSVYKPEEKK